MIDENTIAGDELGVNLMASLESLGEDELDPDEKLAILEEVLKELTAKQYDYEDNIKFDEASSYDKDYILSRVVILDSLDKCKIMSDILIQMLASAPANTILIESLQENIKLAQTSAKALVSLHIDYSKNRKATIGNDELKKKVDDESSDINTEEAVNKALKKAGILFKS